MLKLSTLQLKLSPKRALTRDEAPSSQDNCSAIWRGYPVAVQRANAAARQVIDLLNTMFLNQLGKQKVSEKLKSFPDNRARGGILFFNGVAFALCPVIFNYAKHRYMLPSEQRPFISPRRNVISAFDIVYWNWARFLSTDLPGGVDWSTLPLISLKIPEIGCKIYLVYQHSMINKNRSFFCWNLQCSFI